MWPDGDCDQSQIDHSIMEGILTVLEQKQWKYWSRYCIDWSLCLTLLVRVWPLWSQLNNCNIFLSLNFSIFFYETLEYCVHLPLNQWWSILCVWYIHKIIQAVIFPGGAWAFPAGNHWMSQQVIMEPPFNTFLWNKTISIWIFQWNYVVFS